MRSWFKYVKPYKHAFILGPLCMIAEVIGEVLMPYLLSVIINRATDGSLTVGGSLGVMALMILSAVLMMAGGIGGAYFGAKASIGFSSDLRLDVYKKIQSFSFMNVDKFSTASLVTRTTNDITQMQNFINMILRMGLRSPGMMIGALVMAVSIKPNLSLVFAVILPIMIVVIIFLLFAAFPRFNIMQKKIDKLNSTVRESVTNVRVVKSFVREDFEEEKFKESNRDLKKAGMSASKLMILMQPVMSIFMNGAIIAVVWFGQKEVLAGGMEVGDLSAFLTYVTQILFSLIMVTVLLVMSARAIASAKRIKEVLNEQPDITDDTEKELLTEIERGDIEFKNVSFRYYKHSPDKVLDNINIKIKRGATVGIIGSTGCGKTTLVSLIPRLYDADEGEILIDGKNVRDYTLHTLRESIGMVLQKNVLFSGTIEENLRWGNQNATDEELVAAAKSAEADKFISTFSDGYDTMLDQSGKNVSGGQKQRLCIARALLKKPKIIILDDSTSAVDTATEAAIRESFRNDLKDTTKIIIAQRISSVIDADEIIVMNEGKVTGIGTHDELMAGNEEYREIYYSQNDKKAGDK